MKMAIILMVQYKHLLHWLYSHTAASAVILTARTTNSISLSWTNGDGAGRIVVARLTSSTNVAAADGTDYTFSSSSFTDAGNGTTGTGNIIVYKGTGNSVTISDLKPWYFLWFLCV
jgi:hypothetical protein